MRISTNHNVIATNFICIRLVFGFNYSEVILYQPYKLFASDLNNGAMATAIKCLRMAICKRFNKFDRNTSNILFLDADFKRSSVLPQYSMLYGDPAKFIQINKGLYYFSVIFY
jgi:hypothetical protein